MGTDTKIEWTDATWNPILGCSRVSEGCRNCYAEGIAGRFGNGKPTVYSGLTQIVNGRSVWTGKIVETRKLLEPLSWRTPKRIFVNSMSDLFHENVTDEQRDRIFAVMALCPQHTFQVLTKRPERMLSYIADCGRGRQNELRRAIEEVGHNLSEMAVLDAKVRVSGALNMVSSMLRWHPLANLWLGVSVENCAAKGRIDVLRETPAALRFISFEPLLEYLADLDLSGIGWSIVGGESGPGARPMHPDWARSLRDQCQASEVPFFFKQWGEWKPIPSPLMDPHGFSGGLRKEDVVSGERQCLQLDGTHFDRVFIERVPDHAEWVERIGKKAAGALLDGREWHQFPEVRQ